MTSQVSTITPLTGDGYISDFAALKFASEFTKISRKKILDVWIENLHPASITRRH
jgi:hypothetical protein